MVVILAVVVTQITCQSCSVPVIKSCKTIYTLCMTGHSTRTCVLSISCSSCERQDHAVICYSSQMHPPVQMLRCCQSTSEFCVIKSTSDIMLLQIGCVLISDDKSAFWHSARLMSNTYVARLRLFGVLDTLPVYPTHRTRQDSPVTI